jgi:hypothetical protein
VVAQTPTWIIQPSICIATNIGDECQFQFSIKTKNIPPVRHCLFIDGRQNICRLAGDFEQKISISSKESSLLELKSQRGETILSQMLVIKYQDNKKQRRRVRAPWSIF